MARSDLMKFWKLLNDAKFTGSPSKLTAVELRNMAEANGLLRHEIEAVTRGYREMLRTKNEVGR